MNFDVGCDYSMRIIVFLCFLALSSAELGYQYQQNSPAFEVESTLASSQARFQDPVHYQNHAEFHKHFYAFEAPYDSAEEADQVEQRISEISQKNLNVVFIKAPENKAVAGALNALAKQTSEDKTAIYVLNKQTDSNELASKLSALQAQKQHKPQVHFVKYRTDAEATQAQQHIQAQYAATAGQAAASLQRPFSGYAQQQVELPQQAPHLGYYGPQPSLPSRPQFPEYSQQKELPQQAPALGYFGQPTGLPLQSLPGQSYYPDPSQAANYLQHFAGYESEVLPPLPLPQQQLAPSPYDLDARTGKSISNDFRVNERHRSVEQRMVFPSEGPSRAYLPAVGSSYLPAQKRSRRAHF